MSERIFNVAVVGAGPAGIYAADILSKSELPVSIDLFERLPAPYGLVRYGVAPDHPRIRAIIDALYKILQRGDIQLFANVNVGTDITVAELQDRYDAIIFATGSDRDKPMHLPGQELPEVYGAADFVSWYDAHPDYPRTWPLEAKEVAVLGVGNVALDIARVLAKHGEDMLVTEIPAHIAETLKNNPITDVHVFGRRGPAQVKFTPLELRELGQQPDVKVVVYEEDFEFDEGSEKAIAESKQTKMVVKTLTNYVMEEDDGSCSRRIHIHLFASPVEVLADEEGHVRAIVTERTKLNGDGTVSGTGELRETPVQAVYRAVGYFSSPIPGVPFDDKAGVIPNDEGRILDANGEPIPGLFATGWVKRGPVGLIGSTKSDAQQTIGHIVEDAQAGKLNARGEETGHAAIEALLKDRQIRYTTWDGWELLDAYERKLGEEYGEVEGGRGPRERVKVTSRNAMVAISRNEEVPADLIGNELE